MATLLSESKLDRCEVLELQNGRPKSCRLPSQISFHRSLSLTDTYLSSVDRLILTDASDIYNSSGQLVFRVLRIEQFLWQIQDTFGKIWWELALHRNWLKLKKAIRVRPK